MPKAPRKRISGAAESVLVTLRMHVEDLTKLDTFRKDFARQTKTKLSRAFMFRNGALMLKRHLLQKMNLARKGALHAKKRKEYDH